MAVGALVPWLWFNFFWESWLNAEVIAASGGLLGGPDVATTADQKVAQVKSAVVFRDCIRRAPIGNCPAALSATDIETVGTQLETDEGHRVDVEMDPRLGVIHYLHRCCMTTEEAVVSASRAVVPLHWASLGSLATQSGVRIGSSLADIERAYGPAHPLIGGDRSYQLVEYIDTRKYGEEVIMRFVLRHGHVVMFDIVTSD